MLTALEGDLRKAQGGNSLRWEKDNGKGTKLPSQLKFYCMKTYDWKLRPLGPVPDCWIIICTRISALSSGISKKYVKFRPQSANIDPLLAGISNANRCDELY